MKKRAWNKSNYAWHVVSITITYKGPKQFHHENTLLVLSTHTNKTKQSNKTQKQQQAKKHITKHTQNKHRNKETHTETHQHKTKQQQT